MTELIASAGRTAGTTNGDAVVVPPRAKALGFYLSITACAKDVDDTLDVKIQHTPDGGTTWDDLVHFTQVLGNDADDTWKEMAFINLDVAPEDELREPSTSLAAGNVIQGPIFPRVRAVAAIVDADADGGFTFSVEMSVLR
jgi:hypothetical protein